MVGMIFHSYHELSSNKDASLRVKRKTVDNKILTFYQKNIILLNRLQSKLKSLPEVIKRKSHDLWQVVSNKIDSYFEKIKRNKNDNNKGSVSIYWQSVKEGKRGSGEIQEK